MIISTLIVLFYLLPGDNNFEEMTEEDGLLALADSKWMPQPQQNSPYIQYTKLYTI